MEALKLIRRNVTELNPNATLIEADLAVTLEPGVAIAGKRVVVVEDGPTLTHGGMAYGAGTVAARTAGALLLDPRDFAIGSIAAAYRDYPHIGAVVPALGYSQAQQAELEETLRRSNAEVIVDASPARLDRILRLDAPIARVSYSFEQKSGPSLFALVDDFVSRAFRGLPENPPR
jgi:predicted GTPase